MKEELRGREAGEIGILDEASRLGTVIVFDEVRQSPMPKAEGNTLTLDVLLTHTGNDLEGEEEEGEEEKGEEEEEEEEVEKQGE